MKKSSSFIKRLSSYLWKSFFATLFSKANFAVLSRGRKNATVEEKITKFMATKGQNWKNPSATMDCLLFFGISPKGREGIALALKDYRCAFAFPYTSWDKQCLFIDLYTPSVAFIVDNAARAPISEQTKLHLKKNKIPVLEFASIQELLNVIQTIHIGELHKYFPVVLHGKNWNAKTASRVGAVVYCCQSFSMMTRLIQAYPSDEKLAYLLFDQDEMSRGSQFFNDFCVNRFVYLDKDCQSEELAKVLQARLIPSEILSYTELLQVLLEPCFEYSAADESKPIAVLLNDIGCFSILEQLDKYRLFRLADGISYNALTFSSEYSLVWVGTNVPTKVRNFAEMQGVPVILLKENILSQIGYRKTFATPLFIGPSVLSGSSDSTENLDTLAISPELDDPCLLDRAATFRTKLLAMQQMLLSKDDDNNPDRPSVPEENFALLIWEKEDSSTAMSCQQFLETVVPTELNKTIYCLALSGGKAIQLRKNLSLSLRNRIIFLKHPKDIDVLLPHTSTVHVHGSLLGFEALMADKEVVTYGAPWYAGWGLTTDSTKLKRPRTLTLDQLSALVFFLDASYRAPYSGEILTPEHALAFWYLRQRPDFARLFEGLQNNFGDDPRFFILDLRANYYDAPDVDAELTPLLQESIFGSVLADFLSFSLESPNFEKFLDHFEHDRATDIFNQLTLHAYYMLNYELINFMVKAACKWFDRQAMNEINTLKFYKVYLEGMTRNRFRDSELPKLTSLRYNDNKMDENLGLAYAKILLNAYAYDKFFFLVAMTINFPSNYFLELIKLLYQSSRTTVKEIDIKKRISLRFKIFRRFRRTRVNEGKEDFSQLFIQFINFCLAENRQGMERFSEKFLPQCIEKTSPDDDTETISENLPHHCVENPLSDDAKELLLMTVDMLAANLEVTLAYTLLHRLVPNDKKILRRYKNLDNAFTPSTKRVTSEARLKSIKTACAKAKVNLQESKGFSRRMNLSNTYSIYKHFLKTNDIISQGGFPETIKGIIFIGYYGTFFTAILPVISYCLARRGYAIYPMFNNHIAVPVPARAPLSKFAYTLPSKTGPLRLEWTIDFSQKNISALGINFYDCFAETIAILIRRYVFNWNDQDVQRIFHNYLKQTDGALYWCNQVYSASTFARLKVGVLSQFAYSLPESAIRKFIVTRNSDYFRYILFKTVANYDIVHTRQEVSTKISGFDMGLYPDCRLSFLPARSRFDPWYEARKNDPEFIKAIEQIKQDLRDGTQFAEGGLLDHLREEKAAGKRIVCCIGRLLFDQALHKEGGPGHDDMGDWLRHSVQVAAETPDIILLVRPHPHEHNPVAAVRARQTMRDVLPEELPSNVIYVDPLEMNVQALIGLMDLAVLWLGTAAYELTALGMPVALCSYAGFDQSPFNAIFPESRTAYATLLKSTHYPVPDADSQDRAAASLHYIRTTNFTKPYPYAYVRGNNSFRTTPYYHYNQLEKYFEEGDSRIEELADQILEGFGAESKKAKES